MTSTENTTCDCTYEYGPCEDHGAVLAQREGASLRSADELAVLFLDDAEGIDPQCLAPYGQDVKARALTALEGRSWIEDADLSDELRDVVTQVENYINAVTYWEDGYRIVQLHEDCPLLES